MNDEKNVSAETTDAATATAPATDNAGTQAENGLSANAGGEPENKAEEGQQAAAEAEPAKAE